MMAGGILLMAAGVLIVAAIRMLVWVGEIAWEGRRSYWEPGDLLGFGFLCAIPVLLCVAAYPLVVDAYPLLFAGGL
ncbi:MAG: hypothetical protein HN849_08010 [Victivallales bacterium]|jgi:hypothetical protein|nr:hypothetical protein [Victivallales bacterium]MBT7163467.1 hypothetical protein [Victivallales bacterium]MBT7299440.1 hypothetical protein [Victivallales bacterium]